jgi:saccharopepsin
MIIATLAPLLLIPFAAAGGVHRLKLKKLPQVASNPAFETAYLAEKYGAQSQQLPLMGAGGAGRHVRIGRPGQMEGDDLFWTQQETLNKGGHGVPLSSTSPSHFVHSPLMSLSRLHECAILYRDHTRKSSASGAC